MPPASVNDSTRYTGKSSATVSESIRFFVRYSRQPRTCSGIRGIATLIRCRPPDAASLFVPDTNAIADMGDSWPSSFIIVTAYPYLNGSSWSPGLGPTPRCEVSILNVPPATLPSVMSTKSNPWSGPETTGSGAACTNPTGEVQSPFQRSGASTGEKTYNHRLLSANSDPGSALDRKSTRLNSSHSQISYAVFCLKKKKNKT